MVSVIIPNFNHGPFLEQRIDSVLNQTYSDFEIILLDDCSSDNSRSIIESYRDNPKVSTIIYNSKNSGSPFLQWEQGIELANGEWIWIAESDDWCDPSLLYELINGANNNANCTLSFCQSIIVRERNELIHAGTIEDEKCINGKDFVCGHMIHNNTIVNASMCIFKRSAYHNIGREYTEYKFMGDCVFWIEIALKGTVYVSGKSLNYFRKHANDVTSSAYLKGLYYSEYFNLLDYICRKYHFPYNEARRLNLERYRLFLDDKRVVQPFKRQIIRSYRMHLGFTYYLENIRQYTNTSRRIVRRLLYGVLKTVN